MKFYEFYRVSGLRFPFGFILFLTAVLRKDAFTVTRAAAFIAEPGRVFEEPDTARRQETDDRWRFTFFTDAFHAAAALGLLHVKCVRKTTC